MKQTILEIDSISKDLIKEFGSATYERRQEISKEVARLAELTKHLIEKMRVK